jgi:catalase
MTNEPPSPDYTLSPHHGKTLTRLGVIGVAVLCIVVLFAWDAGYLSPGRLTPGRFTEAFREVYGFHSGFRRNHAKGVCASGYFDGNGEGMALSSAVVFRRGKTPVLGRFSLPGGNPYVADAPNTPRGLALSFSLPDGEIWRTAMLDLPVFTVHTPGGFYEQLLAGRADPRTGKPNPARLATFLANHPETVRAQRLITAHPFSSGFANATYNSLDAFRLTSPAGDSRAVRWSMVPEDAFAPDTPTAVQRQDPNYLFDELIARARRGAIRWHLIVTVAATGDPTNDATVPWPANRERVDTGTLVLNSVQDEADGNCRDVNFDPLILPSGIAPSDDPLLSARSAVYSRDFTLREGEAKRPSAVRFVAVRNGT